MSLEYAPIEEASRHRALQQLRTQVPDLAILFLDFDGVLHPRPKNREWIFCHLPQLEKILAEHPRLYVVIASSWREEYPWDTLVGLFSGAVRSRVVDMTPWIPGARRQEEVEAWLAVNGFHGTWMVLDDDQSEFEPGFPQLFLCQTSIGLDEAIYQRFAAFVRSQLGTT
ncbi:MAG: HAD domain-containing protein [Pseudomonadota bacterium]